MKEGAAALAPESLCIREQLGQRSASSGGDQLETFGSHLLDPSVTKVHLQPQVSRNNFKKVVLFPGRLSQGDSQLGAECRQDQPGKAGPAAEVDQGFRLLRDQGCDLGGVPEV